MEQQVFISWKHKKGGSGLPGSGLRQEMKDMAQEQALLEVADLLQQLKILDNSTKNPESSLSCTYRVGSGRMQRLPISENYLVSMIATVQTDLQKKINSLCKKYRIELEADEAALMGTGMGEDIE